MIIDLSNVTKKRSRYDQIFCVLLALQNHSLKSFRLAQRTNIAYCRLMNLLKELVGKDFVEIRKVKKSVFYDITPKGLLLLGFLKDFYELYFDITFNSFSISKRYDIVSEGVNVAR